MNEVKVSHDFEVSVGSFKGEKKEKNRRRRKRDARFDKYNEVLVENTMLPGDTKYQKTRGSCNDALA